MKKINKKQIMEIKEEYLKSQIETEKETLRRYIMVLAKYDFYQSSTSGIYFREQYDNLLRAGFDKLDSAKLPSKKVSELRHNHIGMFSHLKKGESIQEANLRYSKSLVSWAEHRLSDLKQEVKEKIIKEGIESTKLWSDQFNRNSKLYDELERLSKKPKKKLIHKPHNKRDKNGK